MLKQILVSINQSINQSIEVYKPKTKEKVTKEDLLFPCL